jgi:outer membrane biogenesis lipoprotein LolB
MKAKFAAIVALLVIASLSVAGCTKLTTNTTAPVTQPDQQLIQYIENYNTTLKNEHPNNLTA